MPGAVLSRVLTMPQAPRAVREARLWVRDVLTSWNLSEIAFTAQQITSELLNNVIEHAEDSPTVTLLLMHAAGTLRIEARDGDTQHLPEMKNTDPLDEGGRGLLIVSALSQRWGVRVTEAGKSVWCELDTVQSHIAEHKARRVGRTRGGRP
jgi:anti-sigma regulatory factor (Ser/Thr protein kinase)